MTTEFTPPAGDATTPSSTPPEPSTINAPPPPAGDPTNPPTEPAGGEPPAPTKLEEPATPEVPEKYDFKFPEGVVMDEAVLAKATPILKELKLTNEQGQKLATVLAEVRQADQKAYTDAWVKQNETWSESVRTDQEIGGQAFDENIKLAQSTLAKFDPEGTFKAELDRTGFGNHPGLIRLCLRIGKAMAEDKFHGGGPTTPPTDAAHRMFPNMK